MGEVVNLEVAAEEADLRLDRWFKRHFPALAHGRLEKLLRTGQVRVDGKRAKAGQRLVPGQTIRVPPLPAAGERAAKEPRAVSAADADALRAAVLYRNEHLIAFNKPPGLAVQGGSRTARHLDAMLDALRFDAAERPRLVHRLDKDTSGVLLLARSAASASLLAAAFRHKATRKLYWALVVGIPEPSAGRIDVRIAKRPGHKGERVGVEEDGRRAVTLYRTVEAMGSIAAWLALAPVTGRTHQLRVHCAHIGTPILGDGKYGGKDAFLHGHAVSRKLHLHARELVLPAGTLPGMAELRVTAPLPPHMSETWRFFGLDPENPAADFTEDAWA